MPASITHGLITELLSHWRLCAVLVSSACGLSVFVRMSRQPEYQVIGVAGILLGIVAALIFWQQVSTQGAVILFGTVIDTVWVAGGLVAASLLTHLWLSEGGE